MVASRPNASTESSIPSAFLPSEKDSLGPGFGVGFTMTLGGRGFGLGLALVPSVKDRTTPATTATATTDEVSTTILPRGASPFHQPVRSTGACLRSRNSGGFDLSPQPGAPEP